MKIVNRQTFLSLPAGTIYCKYVPCIFCEFSIKADTLYGANDFCYIPIFEHVDITTIEDDIKYGRDIPIDLSNIMRDGCFDDEQLFAVWDKSDINLLIYQLNISANL